jgi:uncharacterized glyoxalase superfamily protein PhnB
MIPNRSVPSVTVIPVLGYEDVADASAWLCEAFGFTERLRIGNHRIQLHAGDGAVILARGGGTDEPSRYAHVLVRVEDADAFHDRAKAYGARILQPPTDFPYGERQCTVEDPGGHHWVFSQSIADADPLDWGGTPVDLR